MSLPCEAQATLYDSDGFILFGTFDLVLENGEYVSPSGENISIEWDANFPAWRIRTGYDDGDPHGGSGQDDPSGDYTFLDTSSSSGSSGVFKWVVTTSGSSCSSDSDSDSSSDSESSSSSSSGSEKSFSSVSESEAQP
jgi:hypothetical protein